jgi:hypothetical protein
MGISFRTLEGVCPDDESIVGGRRGLFKGERLPSFTK